MCTQFPLINIRCLVVRVTGLIKVINFPILTVLGSRVQSTATKLKKSVNAACLDLQRLCNKEDCVYEEEWRLYKA